MILAYLAELATATRYTGYLLTLNQAAHSLVGAVLAGLIFPAGALLAYVAWEVWQYRRGSRAGWADSVTDAAYAGIGIVGVILIGPALSAFCAVVLLVAVAHGVVTQK